MDSRPPTPARSPDPDGADDPRPGRRAATGRRLCVGVALLEAGVLVVAAVVTLVAGVQGGSLPLAIGVTVVTAGVAYLLLEVARAFAAGRRWPTGIFVTIQLLGALVALSVGSRAVLSIVANPVVGGATLAAVLVALAGLLGVVLAGRGRSGPGDDLPVL